MSGTGRQRGFTLLELLVVMAILVLVVTLFPIALDRALPSRRVTTTTQRIIALIHEAQMASSLSGGPVSLRLLAHDLTATLTESHAKAAQAAAAMAPIHRVSFPASTAVRMLDAEGRAITELLLYPDNSSRGARVEIEDSGRHGTLFVAPITGRISTTASL